jgi:nicotinate-nucleotide--dimethylbenzimidazole phosphoribosyltransferase
LLDSLTASIAPVSVTLAAQVQAQLDQKTKPRGSLGRLEKLACQYCAARGELAATAPKKVIVVMAADHGIAAEGVSAFPQAVTAQMVQNFAASGAAINALAKLAGAELIVVDMGMLTPVQAAGVRDGRIASGTANMTKGPAMTRQQALAAIAYGAKLADELANRGVTLIGLGEMGIGNTASASALTAVLTRREVSTLTGRGTGVDDEGLARKIRCIERALAANASDPGDVLGTLAAVGGFEIAGLCGLTLGAAARRIPVVVDGFITIAAALVAVRLAPATRGYLIGSHRSVEPGYQYAAQAIDLAPLLDLQMRLGEGTGAALAMGLVDAALAILREMATFASAQVSDSGA